MSNENNGFRGLVCQLKRMGGSTQCVDNDSCPFLEVALAKNVPINGEKVEDFDSSCWKVITENTCSRPQLGCRDTWRTGINSIDNYNAVWSV